MLHFRFRVLISLVLLIAILALTKLEESGYFSGDSKLTSFSLIYLSIDLFVVLIFYLLFDAKHD